MTHSYQQVLTYEVARDLINTYIADCSAAIADVSEAVKMAVRALHANLFRTVLTLLGIVIGVGSVVAMLAIGTGAQNSVLDRISSMGSDLLLVRPSMANFRGGGSAPGGQFIAVQQRQRKAAVAATEHVVAAQTGQFARIVAGEHVDLLDAEVLAFDPGRHQ